MISSLLHKRAWRLVPQGGEPKSLSAITRMHKIVCVCARCWTTASAVSVSVTSAGALPCTSTHSLPETAAEPRCVTLCSTCLLQVALCSSGLWMIWRAKWPSLPPVITVCCQWLRPDWVQGASEVMKPPLYNNHRRGRGKKKRGMLLLGQIKESR